VCHIAFSNSILSAEIPKTHQLILSIDELFLLDSVYYGRTLFNSGRTKGFISSMVWMRELLYEVLLFLKLYSLY
jgi:hypothetical protein